MVYTGDEAVSQKHLDICPLFKTHLFASSKPLASKYLKTSTNNVFRPTSEE